MMSFYKFFKGICAICMIYSLDGALLKFETFLCSTVTLQDGTAVDSSQDTVEVRYFIEQDVQSINNDIKSRFSFSS